MPHIPGMKQSTISRVMRALADRRWEKATAEQRKQQGRIMSEGRRKKRERLLKEGADE